MYVIVIIIIAKPNASLNYPSDIAKRSPVKNLTYKTLMPPSAESLRQFHCAATVSVLGVP